MAYLSMIVIILATVIALITDIKDRMIYRQLTLPLFISGLIYSLYDLLLYTGNINVEEARTTTFLLLLQAWLGPVLFVFIYSLFLFWLGVLAGGDGQFLIAVTPWLGAQNMIEAIFYFNPAAFLYLAYHLLRENRFNLKRTVLQQCHATITMVKSFSIILRNIRNGEVQVLVKNIPYESNTKIPPAGMVPISISVFLSLLI